MDSYYDHSTGEWVTDWTRYEAVLAEQRFSPIRDHEIESWPAEKAWALLLTFLHAVPEDTVPFVGSGPLENLINERAADFIAHIEAALQIERRLRRALLNVNLDRGALPPALEHRLIAAAGPQFRLLESDSA